jgi:hypothetical protein
MRLSARDVIKGGIVEGGLRLTKGDVADAVIEASTPR